MDKYLKCFNDLRMAVANGHITDINMACGMANGILLVATCDNNFAPGEFMEIHKAYGVTTDCIKDAYKVAE